MSLLIALLFAILPSCESETSSNCSWDASSQGNGLGSSFIDLNGIAYYVR